MSIGVPNCDSMPEWNASSSDPTCTALDANFYNRYYNQECKPRALFPDHLSAGLGLVGPCSLAIFMSTHVADFGWCRQPGNYSPPDSPKLWPFNASNPARLCAPINNPVDAQTILGDAGIVALLLSAVVCIVEFELLRLELEFIP